MKRAMVIVGLLAVVGLIGCAGGTRGGGMGKDQSFGIEVPAYGMMPVTMKQGETKVVKVTLTRGKYFKQDVRLQIRASDGIKVEPTEVTVKACESPDVMLNISTPECTALGEYRIYLKGIPESGEPASQEIKVKVKS